MRFDTDYVETRRVHNIVPFISVDGGRYGVPPEVLGQLVEIRRPVDGREFTVRHGGGSWSPTLDPDPSPTKDIIWRPEHRARVEAIAMAGRSKSSDGRHLHLVTPRPPTPGSSWSSATATSTSTPRPRPALQHRRRGPRMSTGFYEQIKA
ncbi:MAG: hypothetical protein R2715_02700 [Ilumatobacteraceae bacterium]